MSVSFKIVKMPSTFCDARNPAACVDTIVIHSMYAPGCEDELSIDACKALLDSVQVSAHFIIDRDGKIVQLVDEYDRAWHAGVSCMPFEGDKRDGVNHFSLGIELIATEESGFTDCQYEALVQLSLDLINRHPVKYVVGHADIAPQRKTDPWNFDWPRYRAELLAHVGADADLSFAR